MNIWINELTIELLINEHLNERLDGYLTKLTIQLTEQGETCINEEDRDKPKLNWNRTNKHSFSFLSLIPLFFKK